jgi:nicotinamide N-methyltransferase
LLWNAGRTIADYLEQNKATLLKDKTVLELGAGAGLPSLIAALNGAAHVVVTDYPDHDLVANLQKNIDSCDVLPSPRNISAAGFLWGADVSSLVEQLPSKRLAHGFDLLILADLLFNHSEHHKLVRSVQDALTRSPSAQALVFFTPYRPWLFQKDLAFFDLAREGGFVVEKILEKTMDKVMFEEDPGVGGMITAQRADVSVLTWKLHRTNCFEERYLGTACGGPHDVASICFTNFLSVIFAGAVYTKESMTMCRCL